eukprot:TRINITY_DN7242_c0_g1_i1.p1 TRINITY_DN7242_c0_g1~~TRINITY_DN7242_c0_g1_i1.p1  ORF type:complete len:332 (+),score=53.40 TRINITY_DN7242_c0_g1_i1:152-1147(+)
MQFTFSGKVPAPGESFGEDGLFYWLGSSGGTKEYENPAESGVVECKWSSHGGCSMNSRHALVANSPSSGWTRDEPMMWMQADLGKDLHFCPDYICIRGCATGATSQPLRNWEFQGSNDEMEWETLRKHEDDESLPVRETAPCAAWPVETTKGYRFFRLLQVGPNGDGKHFLACGGMELYGTLFEACVIVNLEFTSIWCGAEPVPVIEDTVMCTNVAGDVVLELQNDSLQKSVGEARQAVADSLGLAACMVQMLLLGGHQIDRHDEETTLLEMLLKASTLRARTSDSSSRLDEGQESQEMGVGSEESQRNDSNAATDQEIVDNDAGSEGRAH